MNYIIRHCERRDMPALINLCEAHAAYERATYTRNNKQQQLEAAIFAVNPPLYCWVVEHGGAVVGYACYFFEYSTWGAGTILYMDCLYLMEQYRGFGIGREIINRLKLVATQKKCLGFEWQTPVFNHDGIHFYKKIGAAGNEKIRFALAI